MTIVLDLKLGNCPAIMPREACFRLTRRFAAEARWACRASTLIGLLDSRQKRAARSVTPNNVQRAG